MLCEKNHFQEEDSCPVGMGGKKMCYPIRKREGEEAGNQETSRQGDQDFFPTGSLRSHLQVNNCLKQGENEHKSPCPTYPRMGTREGTQFDSNAIVMMDAVPPGFCLRDQGQGTSFQDLPGPYPAPVPISCSKLMGNKGVRLSQHIMCLCCDISFSSWTGEI